MNNSKISIDNVRISLEEPVDNTEKLREIEARLIRIIEVIGKINQSEEWSTLKSLVFDSRISQLEKQLISESEKNQINDSEIYRLQGRLFEARKYDLQKLEDSYRVELSKIKKLTQPTER